MAGDPRRSITVVIPTCNRPDGLARAVRSALAQPAVDEVVVVDDGCDPPVRLDGLPGPRLRVVRQDRNRGVSAARNRGWRDARSTHLIFLDDDDTLLPLAGRAFRRWLTRLSDPDTVACGSVLVDRPGRLPLLRRPPRSRAGEIWGLDTHLLRGGRHFATKQAAMIPRSLLERTGGWDEELRSRVTSEFFFRLTAIAPVEAHVWPVYRLNRGTHARLTLDADLRERSVAYIRGRHAQLLSDPARRAAFEDNHAGMMVVARDDVGAPEHAR